MERVTGDKNALAPPAGGPRLQKPTVFVVFLSRKTQVFRPFPWFASLTIILERVTGVEPVSHPWQGRIIAAIRYPHLILFGGLAGTRTRVRGFADRCLTTRPPGQKEGVELVPMVRIELTTQGFSVLCSTTELHRRIYI